MNLKLGNQTKKGLPFALIIFNIIYLMFSIEDLAASRQTGFKAADRSTAHIILLCITIFLLLYYIFSTPNKRYISNKTFIVLIALLFWTTMVNLLQGTPTWTLLVNGNMSLLWVLSFSFFESIRYKSYDGKPIKTFVTLFFLFFIGATVFYCFDAYARLGRFQVLNIIYNAVALLPWFLVDNRTNKKGVMVLFIITFAASMLSMKRGAIIAIVLMVLTYFFIQSTYKKNYANFGKVVFLTIVMVIAVKIADNLSGGFLSARFSAEEIASGSGRMHQITVALDLLRDANFSNLLFGHGVQSALNMFGAGIHNEWLHFLFCYGIVGLVLYAIMVVGFFRQSIRISRINRNLSVPCFMMSIFYFVLSMISSGYGGYIGLLLFGFWGFVNAEYKLYSIEE